VLSRWLPVVVWAVLISSASTSYLSSEVTGSVLKPILQWLFPSLSIDQLELLHWFVRKAAHFIEFGVFSALLYRAVDVNPIFGLPTPAKCLLISGIYAGLDELHQSIVPGRTASGLDALIDLAGAVAAQALLAAWHARRR